MATPLRSLENAPFLENLPLKNCKICIVIILYEWKRNLPLKEAKNHYSWESFQEDFEERSSNLQGYILFFGCKTSKVIPSLIDSGSFLEYI